MAFVNDFNTGKTIDVTRGIVLSIEGHDRENNYTFLLEVRGKPVKFYAQYKLLSDGEGQASLSWKVSNLTIPDNFIEGKNQYVMLSPKRWRNMGFFR